MATLPVLKTGAVTQYPLTARVRHKTEVLRYLDGAEQRYREYKSGLREWVIRLDRLDEAELAALDEFFASNQGGFASFAFVDPSSGVQYPDCSVAEGELGVEIGAEMRARATLTIRENRV